jgi:hypothetical protein
MYFLINFFMWFYSNLREKTLDGWLAHTMQRPYLSSHVHFHGQPHYSSSLRALWQIKMVQIDWSFCAEKLLLNWPLVSLIEGRTLDHFCTPDAHIGCWGKKMSTHVPVLVTSSTQCIICECMQSENSSFRSKHVQQKMHNVARSIMRKVCDAKGDVCSMPQLKVYLSWKSRWKSVFS